MVIQREQPIHIWGWAKSEALIKVYLNKSKYTTEAQKDGYWTITLPSRPAGGPFRLTIKSGFQKITISDLYIGDVWVCSGQSNMRLPVANTQNADKEIGSAKDALIRHLEISPSYALRPTLELHDNNWEVNSPQTVGSFTATGYYFARFLREYHKIPIGLIHSSWSGSRIETWIGNQLTNAEKLSKKQLSLPHHQKDLAYNKMIHPLTKFPIKGCLLYTSPSPRDATLSRMPSSA